MDKKNNSNSDLNHDAVHSLHAKKKKQPQVFQATEMSNFYDKLETNFWQ